MKEIVHVMFSREQVENRIKEMADQINEEYGMKPLRLICILKGSVFFSCELAKHLKMPVTIDFMSVSSYGNSTSSSGKITIKKDLEQSIQGVDCLLIEDIIDTGYTLSMLKPMLLERKPESFKICTLLNKPDRREVEMEADYTGFSIPDEFVDGYGLDYAQKYRNLPFVGTLEFIEE